MKRNAVCLVVLLLFSACSSPKPTTSSSTDPTGAWSGDYTSGAGQREDVSLELRMENNDLKGVVRSGPRSLPLTKASFKPDTGAIAFEFDAQNNGRIVHYMIEGKLEGNTMTGNWTHDSQRGEFRVTRK
jgi:hypothetical protein